MLSTDITVGNTVKALVCVIYNLKGLKQLLDYGGFAAKIYGIKYSVIWYLDLLEIVFI